MFWLIKTSSEPGRRGGGREGGRGGGSGVVLLEVLVLRPPPSTATAAVEGVLHLPAMAYLDPDKHRLITGQEDIRGCI